MPGQQMLTGKSERMCTDVHKCLKCAENGEGQLRGRRRCQSKLTGPKLKVPNKGTGKEQKADGAEFCPSQCVENDEMWTARNEEVKRGRDKHEGPSPKIHLI